MDKKIAVLFVGQGAQYPGMGKDLYDNYRSARAVFDALESLLPGVKEVCFEGTQEELNRTAYAQPCLMASGLAAAYALNEHGITARGAAGFSLGEVSALVYSGVIGILDGIKLVAERARLMSIFAEQTAGAMAAVLGADDGRVQEIAKELGVFAVNYNCPGQVVVAGEQTRIDGLIERAKDYKVRAVKLKVSGAFHCPYMDGAAQGVKDYLGALVELREPIIDLYSNYTAGTYKESELPYTELISRHINHPVKWAALIGNMLRSGYTHFVELGAGRTLAGLLKKIDGNAQIMSADNAAGVQAAADWLKA